MRSVAAFIPAGKVLMLRSTWRSRPSFLLLEGPSDTRESDHTTYIIIIMYIYHALINASSAHMIHIHLNMIFYTHVEHSPTETIYIKY